MKPGPKKGTRPKGLGKGSEYERTVCKRLSLWWTDGERDDIFWRTAGSGAWATTRGKKGEKTYGSYGDVAALDPIGEPLIKLVTIEIKRGHSPKPGKGPSDYLNVLDLLDYDFKTRKKSPLLIQWWRKLSKDCFSAEAKYPWLIFKRDRAKPCIVVSQTFMDDLSTTFDHLLCCFTPFENLWIIRFDHFLAQMNPHWFGKEPKND